jgi:hypothetical protein
LAYAYETSPPSQTLNTVNYQYDLVQTTLGQDTTSTVNEEVSNRFFVSGLQVTDGGGFDADVSAGSQSSTLRRAEVLEGATYTLNASKDYYFYHDAKTNSIIRKETALGAGEPTIAESETYIGKVVTDGSGIVSATDGRETLAIEGSKLKAGTGVLTHLDSGGVFDSFANITTTSFDDVDDGSTWYKLQDVDSSNQAVASSVKENALGSQQMVSDSEGRNHNFDFSMWTRG